MNCKPGDLAIVVRSRTPANLGKLVEVLRIYTPGTEGFISLDKSKTIWMCATKGADLALDNALNIGTTYASCVPIPDECLRPIRSDADPIDDEASNARSLEIVA